mmetsp:Transcript_33148/g.104864  ORF Transcript_33148/g.104864 Transcript_33148/m.104864 type:complete len:249 (-) Transcript_33148:280-1026(-)
MRARRSLYPGLGARLPHHRQGLGAARRGRRRHGAGIWLRGGVPARVWPRDGVPHERRAHVVDAIDALPIAPVVPEELHHVVRGRAVVVRHTLALEVRPKRLGRHFVELLVLRLGDGLAAHRAGIRHLEPLLGAALVEVVAALQVEDALAGGVILGADGAAVVEGLDVIGGDVRLLDPVDGVAARRRLRVPYLLLQRRGVGEDRGPARQQVVQDDGVLRMPGQEEQARAPGAATLHRHRSALGGKQHAR